MMTILIVFFAGVGLLVCIFLFVAFLLIYLGDRK
jgi:hypothetical protein